MMKRTLMFLNGIALSALLASLSAFAADDGATDYSATAFTLSENLNVAPLAVDASAAAPRAFALDAGTQIVVLEERNDERFGAVVRVGLDVEEGDALPSDFWIPQRELPGSILVPFQAADEAGAIGGNEGDLGIYKAMTYCYRFVKQYLLHTGRVSGYLPGSSAWQAAGILPRYGFHRTGHSPSSAVNGEVCVYSGGPAGHGHIEIKRNGAWWYGYGFINHPMKGRRFMACFNK